MKTYNVDVDFYSMELRIKAKNKAEARKKAKELLKKKINSHVNHMYIEDAGV